MGIEKLDIDIELHASSTCRNINACCRSAIVNQVEMLGEASADIAAAALVLTCGGRDEILGCQAEITGTLLDSAGNRLANIDTSAQKLFRADDPNELLQEIQQQPEI